LTKDVASFAIFITLAFGQQTPVPSTDALPPVHACREVARVIFSRTDRVVSWQFRTFVWI